MGVKVNKNKTTTNTIVIKASTFFIIYLYYFTTTVNYILSYNVFLYICTCIWMYMVIYKKEYV